MFLTHSFNLIIINSVIILIVFLQIGWTWNLQSASFPWNFNVSNDLGVSCHRVKHLVFDDQRILLHNWIRRFVILVHWTGHWRQQISRCFFYYSFKTHKLVVGLFLRFITSWQILIVFLLLLFKLRWQKFSHVYWFKLCDMRISSNNFLWLNNLDLWLLLLDTQVIWIFVTCPFDIVSKVERVRKVWIFVINVFAHGTCVLVLS